MPMTRDEHLKWCKDRALEYVNEGDLQNAVASMISDLRKHDDFTGPVYAGLGMVGMMEIPKGSQAVRCWIEGFN